MNEKDRDTIIKVLRMLSSPHDGEAASAARRAHHIMSSRGLDWAEVIAPASAQQSNGSHNAEEDVDDDAHAQADAIRRCRAKPAMLTQWEATFLQSIEEWVKTGPLTEKQQFYLDRIVTKLKQRGQW